MRPRAAALLLALSATLSAACGKSVGEGSRRLAVEAPRWWFSHLPVAIEITPKGLLAERASTVVVSVGSNLALRRDLAGKPVTIRISSSFFAAGRNEVAVKTGSERAVVEVAIVSVVWLVALVALVAAIAGAIVARWRKRRAG